MLAVAETRPGLDFYKEWGQGQSRVDPPSFGMDYGSISFGQLPGYIVVCILLVGGGEAPPTGTVYNVARKLAKRNGAIIYVNTGRIYLTLYLALLFLIVYRLYPAHR